jgi:nucleoside-diphosphate-sugar epimerase
MKRVAIVGAGGFIGAHLVHFLGSQGIHVLAFDLNMENIPAAHNVDCYHIDLQEPTPFKKYSILASEIDAVYHLAWIGVASEARDDFSLQISNIDIGLKVLSFCKEISAKRIVIPGSASEYAMSGTTITGEGAFAPVDAYGAAKAACHTLYATYAERHGLSLTWAVTASLYGPGRNDNNILSYAIAKLLSGEKPSFTRLEQRWDFIHVDDLILALYLLGKSDVLRRSYAVASGENRCMFEYITILRDKIDPKLPLGIGELPYKNDKPDHSIFDISAIQSDIGFMPKVPFEIGIGQMIDYFRHK